jgi:hypothetical protein
MYSIIITTFHRMLGLGESTSPVVISYKYSRRRRRKQDKMKNNPQNRIASPDRIW